MLDANPCEAQQVSGALVVTSLTIHIACSASHTSLAVAVIRLSTTDTSHSARATSDRPARKQLL